MSATSHDSIETYRGLVRRALPVVAPAYLVLAIPPNPGAALGPLLGSVMCVVVLAALLLIGRRWDADRRHPAPFRLATSGAAIAAIGFGMVALEGREAAIAPLLFVVVASGAAMGGRLHLAFVWFATLAAYVSASLAGGVPTGYVISSAVVVATAIASLQACIRFAVRRLIALAEHNDVQRRIVAAAAQASDLESGLAEMVPLTGEILRTAHVTAEAVDLDGSRRAIASLGGDAPSAGVTALDVGPSSARERIVLTVGLDGRPDQGDLEIVCDLYTPLVARARYVTELERSVAVDALTGVASRRELERVLQRLVSDRVAHTVVMLDLNGLKEHNDTLGHLAGDAALATAGEILRGLGPDVLAARYGGDEFILVLEGRGRADADHVVERLLAVWAEQMPVGVACGVAEWDGAESPEALVGRADAALYDDKRTRQVAA